MTRTQQNDLLGTMIIQTDRENRIGKRVRIKTEPKIASEMKVKGICSTCNHATTCTFLKKAEQPIYFCEEFDDNIASEIKNLFQPIPSLNKINKNLEYSNGFKGLCINCDKRASCFFRTRAANISFCEEYQ